MTSDTLRRDAPEASVSTTDRVARVLLAFSEAPGPLGVSEVARACSLSKAVVHRILQALLGTGLVAYLAEQRRYALGPAALALGRRAAVTDDLRRAAMPVLAHLADVTGETTTLSARVGHGRYYVDQVESFKPIRITISIGEHAPLWNGASGLSILAFMDQVDVDYVLSRPLERFTPATMTDPAELRDRLAAIRDRGWAHSAGERVRYSSSIAAPVFNVEGSPVGSLSVAYLVDRIDDSEHEELAALVMTAANDATERLRRLERGEAE